MASQVWRPLPACELVQETRVLAMQLCLILTRPVAASTFEAFGIGITMGITLHNLLFEHTDA